MRTFNQQDRQDGTRFLREMPLYDIAAACRRQVQSYTLRSTCELCNCDRSGLTTL